VAVLIDASILIERERGRLDFAQHLSHRPGVLVATAMLLTVLAPGSIA
jgi:hypothetical protein